LIVPAPAKVNLLLRVLGRRADGFHDLDTVIVPIDIVDTVEVHAASDPGQFRTLSLSLSVQGEAEMTKGVPIDESNLLLRAAKALADRIEARGFADIRLTKRIPSAAGLGGGSSDAAAVLRALNALWGAALDQQDLREVAAETGSDVPALLDPRPVRARGRGERLEPVTVPEVRLALVTFPFGVSTADAFGWWDADGGRTGPDPGSLGAGPITGAAGWLYNDLETSVVRRHPLIGQAKEALLAAGAEAVLLSGSGPTLAGVLPEEREKLDAVGETEILRMSGSAPMYARSWDWGPA
jgi:4-diphosphocytidyl-2-C-methyl-D-erythritol kinase